MSAAGPTQLDPDEFRAKLASWIADNPAETAQRLVEEIYDTISDRFVLPDAGYGSDAAKVIRKLQRKRNALMRMRNGWAEPGAAYRGVHTGWRDPGGQPFEVQFHTTESLAAREFTEDMHREACDPATPPARRKELYEQIQVCVAAVGTPSGLDQFPPSQLVAPTPLPPVEHYAIVRAGRDRTHPSGVVRRRFATDGFIDESLHADLTWMPSTALLEHARGELAFDLEPMSSAEVDAIAHS